MLSYKGFNNNNVFFKHAKLVPGHLSVWHKKSIIKCYDSIKQVPGYFTLSTGLLFIENIPPLLKCQRAVCIFPSFPGGMVSRNSSFFRGVLYFC